MTDSATSVRNGLVPAGASRAGDVRSANAGEGLDGFLQLLARALRQFHAYPSTNPLCVDAITACQKALVSLHGGDDLTLDVTPHGLLIDGHDTGSVAMVEQELSRRLRRARIDGLRISRDATRRDLTRFCVELVRRGDSTNTGAILEEVLTEEGVTGISVRVLQRPEVLDIGAPSDANRDLMTHERRRREERPGAETVMGHLYAPNRGWIRVDPGAPPGTVSLVDLAILVDNPQDLASMLDRLGSDMRSRGDDAGAALEHKFSEVARLFAALEPQLARVMFSKLARVVLDMSAERRQRLLKGTILPGLLDGHLDGTILRDFPDPDIAESLCLLLDLETAAPEVVTTALDRLNLTPERRNVVIPHVEEQMRRRGFGPGSHRPETEADLDRHARRLTRVEVGERKNFSEFAAFDLAVTDATRASVEELRDRVVATDPLLLELDCLTSLVRLQANPDVVSGFLTGILERLARLEKESRWGDVATCTARLAEIGSGLAERRPDVADAITRALGEFATRERAATLLTLHETDEAGRAVAARVLDALGSAIAPALLSLVSEPAASVPVASVMNVLCQRAAVLAPMAVFGLVSCPPAGRPHVIRVLGFAGPGYEAVIGEEFAARDERITREALRALARIGTPHAAALVVAQVDDREEWVRNAALEMLGRFPPEHTDAQVKQLLGSRSFVLRYPEAAGGLLERAAAARTNDLAALLQGLAAFRYRFWNRPLVRVARRAQQLLRQ